MSYPNSAYNRRPSGNTGYPANNASQQQQRQAYLSQIQPRMLQTQYPSTAMAQYTYTTSSYPPYTPRSGAPQTSYATSATRYDNDQASPTSDYPARNYSMAMPSYENDEEASSPSSVFSGRSYHDTTPYLSPVSPVAQRQPDEQPTMKSYYCLVEGCNKTTARAACMERHVSNVHFKELAERIDCTVEGCNRVGKKGFTRKDKLYEHMREVHRCDVPKRRGTGSSRAPPPGADLGQEGPDDLDAYGRGRGRSLSVMDDE